MIPQIKSSLLYKLTLLVTGLIFIAQFSTAQKAATGNPVELIKTVDSILQNHINDNKIPGAVIQIKKDGKVIYKQAYGYAQKFNYDHELLSNPEKMTTGHLFDIASLTKAVGTTTCIMLLADRGLMGRTPVRLRTLGLAGSLATLLIGLNLWLVGTA